MSVARYISIQSQDAGFLFALNTRFEDIWNSLDQSGAKIGSTISGGTANQVLFANSLLQLDSDAGLIYTKTSQTLQAKHITIGDGSATVVSLDFYGASSTQTIQYNTYTGTATFTGNFAFPTGGASFGTSATDARITVYQLGAGLDAMRILGVSNGLTLTTFAESVGNSNGVLTVCLGSMGSEDSADSGMVTLWGNPGTAGLGGRITYADRSLGSNKDQVRLNFKRGATATSGVFTVSVRNAGTMLDDIFTVGSNGALSGYGITPIGSIVGWSKSLTGTPSLPDGWVECNGQVLSDSNSVYNGRTMPSLNSGQNRFLRGNSTSGGTGGSSSHLHTVTAAAHVHDIDFSTTGYTDPDYSSIDVYSSCGAYASQTSHAHGFTVCVYGQTSSTGTSGTSDAQSNLPPYYDVVQIIRVK